MVDEGGMTLNPAFEDPTARGAATPLHQPLHQDLRRRIIRAELPPGARLSETEVARGFGASRQPVREAFIRLAQEGLVDVRPQRGTYVRRISVEAVAQARFVREAIEADVARTVAERCDAALVAGLRRQIAHQAAADTDAFLPLDEQFHRTLFEAAGAAYAWRIVDDAKAQMDRVRWLSTARMPNRDALVAQHTAVVDALEARDAAAAEAAMRAHLRRILGDLAVMRETMPDFFDPAP
jgi:GntR family transcriptional regulator, rspAB operon transcriptional repressor